MEVLKSLNQDLSHEDFHKKKELIMKKLAPVATYTSIRTIIALASKMKWKLHQMDVKTAFLNGVIEDEVYIEQPPGLETHDKETHVCAYM